LGVFRFQSLQAELRHCHPKILRHLGVLHHLGGEPLAKIAAQQCHIEAIAFRQNMNRHRFSRVGPFVTHPSKQRLDEALRHCIPLKCPGDREKHILDHMHPCRHRIDRDMGEPMSRGQEVQYAGNDLKLVRITKRKLHRAAAGEDEIGEVLALDQLQPFLRRDSHLTPF